MKIIVPILLGIAFVLCVMTIAHGQGFPMTSITWKPIANSATRTDSVGGTAYQLDPGVRMNENTLLAEHLELGTLARTDPALATILNKYVAGIYDPNGMRVWP